MSGTQITMLVPESARSIHAELLTALGTETNPSQWMLFMDAVTRLLPDVLSPGRPTREAIQRSAIGQLGFKSWREMIESPIDAGGLGWNWSGWKAWRRAWTIVQAYPWLREQPIGSSELNALQQELSRSETPFPQSLEQLDAYRAERETIAAERRNNSIASLNRNLEEAQLRATQAEAQVVVLAEQLEAARTHNTSLGRQLEQLEAQAQGLQQAHLMSRWQHLWAFLTGH